MKTLHNHTITIHRKIQSWEKSKLKRVDTQHNGHVFIPTTHTHLLA